MKVKPILWTYAPHDDGTCDVKVYAFLEGKKKYIGTGISVKPDDWDGKKHQVRRSNPYHTGYNSIIQKKVLEVTQHIVDTGELPNPAKKTASGSLLQFGETYIEEVRKGLHDIRLSTCKNYEYAMKRLREYAAHTGAQDVKFDDITLDWYFGFCGFLADHCNCNRPGISKHIKQVKKLMGEAMARGLHRNEVFKDAKFRVYNQTISNKVYLTASEIAKLEALDLSTQPALQRERDRFLVSYYLIMRYSDSIRIKPDHFFEQDGRTYYRNIAQKTGNLSVLPVKPVAWQIIQRNNFRFDGDTNQEANRKLKVIAAMAGIVQIVKEGDKEGPKCNFISTHTARRSAATNLALSGEISLDVLASLGGWKQVDTLKLYLRASGMDKAKAAAGATFFM